MYNNSVELTVYGDYALFSDPITRVGGEKWSYQIPTYEALKGILSSVYWKPTFIWYIDAVRVMKPIQTEVKGIRPIKYNGGKNELSYYTYLKDVEYHIKAHFEWNHNRRELEQDRNVVKHEEIAKRMIKKGGRRDIFLGARECQAYVEPCCFDEGKGFYDDISELAFGPMFHGFTYADEAYDEKTAGRLTQNFWKPIMKNGVIEFCRSEDCEHRYLHETKVKVFENKKNFQPVSEFDV